MIWYTDDFLEYNRESYSIRFYLLGIARRFFEDKEEDLITKFFEFGGYNLHIIITNNYYDKDLDKDIGKITFKLIKKENLDCLAAESHYVTIPTINEKNRMDFIFEVSGLDRLIEQAKAEEKRLEQLTKEKENII